MLLRYEGDGIKCEFLLMTVGDRSAPGQKGKKAKGAGKGVQAPQLEATTSRASSHASTPVPQFTAAQQGRPMPPPLRPSNLRLSQRPPPPAFDDDDSLFVAQENDNQWEPLNLNEEEEEDGSGRLEWSASAQPVSTIPTLSCVLLLTRQNSSGMHMRSAQHQAAASNSESIQGAAEGAPAPSNFEPTQRLSEVRKYGLFGE